MEMNSSNLEMDSMLSVHDGHLDKEKSRSTEFIDECQLFRLDTCPTLSTRAYSTWDLFRGETKKKFMKADQDMFSRARPSKTTKGIPFSVKYAVSPPQKISYMDRSGLGAMDTKPSSSQPCGTDLLDQTLNSIRANLNVLHNETVEMENKMTYIMEDIRSALTQTHNASTSKGHRICAKSNSSSILNNQEDSLNQIFFTVQETCQPSITSTRDLSPAESPTSSFNRSISMRQKLTSIVLSPSQFIRQSTTSTKSSTLPPSHSTADSACMVHTKKTYQNSMPESFVISTIPEDSMEANIYNQYTVQQNPYNKTEEGLLSSKSTIVRRSSLTGQLEQDYKFPVQNMEDSDTKTETDGCDKEHTKERSKKKASTSSSTHSIITGSPQRKTEKFSSKANTDTVIFLPSTETTV